ncbi:hypothetical protein [Marinibactrum halimedae]|uniref:Uncharacterized protein n=1 Tax=Marinibactrum halimedae TaxID=1444977 RepID=A0AA37T0Y9_9GAMM|nr:hypothetical protein [Marinibactrum halimedae]MCD9457638.1 hypothetical protein [Marinibactrum halimedae]GLS24990.1 hypothetical protein GCM10007877_07040 [Marinibactrum halimedae]
MKVSRIAEKHNGQVKWYFSQGSLYVWKNYCWWSKFGICMALSGHWIHYKASNRELWNVIGRRRRGHEEGHSRLMTAALKLIAQDQSTWSKEIDEGNKKKNGKGNPCLNWLRLGGVVEESGLSAGTNIINLDDIGSPGDVVAPGPVQEEQSPRIPPIVAALRKIKNQGDGAGDRYAYITFGGTVVNAKPITP